MNTCKYCATELMEKHFALSVHLFFLKAKSAKTTKDPAFFLKKYPLSLN